MRMLEFRAIDLDAGAGIAEKRFRKRFNHARLSGTSGSQKQQIADRTSRRIQPGQKHLINLDNLLNRSVLTHDLAVESAFEVAGVSATAVGIENRAGYRLHSGPALLL